MTRSTHDIIKSLIVGFAVVELCLTWGEAVRWAAFAAELAAQGDSLNYSSPLKQHGALLVILLVAAVVVRLNQKWSPGWGTFLSVWFLLYSTLDLRNFFLSVRYYSENTDFGLGNLMQMRWFWLGEVGIRVFPRFICGVVLLAYSIRGLRALKLERLRTEA